MNAILKKYAILGLFVSLSSCEFFEDNDRRTYYDVIGVGYVYHKETKEPAVDAQVHIWSYFRSNGWATVQPIIEYYPTDNNGYYSIKFLKRTRREDVLRYTIGANKDNFKYNLEGGRPQPFTAEDVQMARGVIQVDTLWLVFNPNRQ